ncbi:uncharacterized protein LOC133890007 [Phragmites australis]|uniref:uncharacterized protein LOC133890007 n=1 Tax=Phragmites australis TaxID=29695 RepID=UPI002D7703A1|nr:uncharacterized protein LOC133890007 [Phragmites australis]
MGCGASQHAGESWADDGEWEEETSSEEGDHHHERKEHALEVTIRITRRQLQELMEKKGDGHGRGRGSRRATEQLLADIMNSGEVHHHDHHGEAHCHWKPALQSIPEAVES